MRDHTERNALGYATICIYNNIKDTAHLKQHSY